MTNLTRFLSLTSILTLAFVSGCATSDEETNGPDEEMAQVQEAVTCVGVPATHQAHATKAFAYILGGTSNPGTGGLASALTSFRTKVTGGTMQVFAPVSTTICGSAAGKARVAAMGLTLAEANQLKGLGNLADTAWGTGASSYVYVDGASVIQDPTDPHHYIFTAWFDPEPAKLTQSISGSTGSTAAAVYVNSGAATSVVKWPSTPGAGSIAAGTPCTTGDASVNTQTLHVIQVLSNGYRRCL